MMSPPNVPRSNPTISKDLSICWFVMAWTTASIRGEVLITADTGPAGPAWKAIVSSEVPRVVGRLATNPRRKSCKSKSWLDQ